jgi:formylglycine-generating enzyme required for sulfatase activity
VIRGGSWGLGAANCRLARRFTYVPASRFANTGFRLALSPSGSSPEAKGEQSTAAADK